MAFDYINEAFRSLESLTEDIFSTGVEGIRELANFKTADSEDDTMGEFKQINFPTRVVS